VLNAGAPTITNTFVGTVIPSPVTNSFSAGIYSLVGSPLPIGGNLTDTNLNLGPVLANKSSVLAWDNSGSGAYVSANKLAGVWTTNLNIAVGQGVFVLPSNTTNWVQTLPPSP
jgi:hypothetical protein